MNDRVELLRSRYAAQRRSGELAAAAETLKAVLSLDPYADWAYDDLARLLCDAGLAKEAEQVARTALRANPRNANAHQLFATLLSERNDLTSGEWHFRRALELGGEQADCVGNLALNLLRQGRTTEADTLFARADKLAPNNTRTLAHWSKLYEVRGDLQRAGELLDRAQAASSPESVNLLRANYLARVGDNEAALALIGESPSLRGDALLERGRLRERLGRYDEAWSDFQLAKKKLAVENGSPDYDARSVEAFFGRLKHFCVRSNIELLPRTSARLATPQPIFIMGFPRSGTTLIEQVLSSHSCVRAGGELIFLSDMRRLANLLFPGSEPFPENLAQTWTADNRYAASLFRDYYLARAEGGGLFEDGKPYFTDKMPFNEIWLPLVRMAFPAAKIVRIVRHPLDVCVSMLSNNLTHGFNCGYSIDAVVHHLVAVHDLVAHYRRELQVDELVLRYEAFVAEQEPQTRLLLDYLGLDFEDACLRFHENSRYAPTPSYAQVTQQLNDRSIGRYQHYAKHLEPYLPRLARVLADCSYRV
jgi:Tfp pilus assembly protein PilF